MQVMTFQQAVLNWFETHGRKDLPWQQNPTPYRVWISEIMLQQTQVATVIPYFNQFTAAFPDVESLARAPLDEVLRLWAGLGYYARARNLHQAAQLIIAHGNFPDTLQSLCSLPGIGRSTAGAILSIAFNIGTPILDGNVKRVLSRFHAVGGWPGDPKVSAELWQISQRYTPTIHTKEYTQAMMDLGATVCTRNRPLCELCPLATECSARNENRIIEFPAPKPRQKLPARRCVFLLAANRNREILLLRRPTIGIWGGLWCLPQFDDAAAALAWCGDKIGTVNISLLLTERRHSFSHYHLDYAPLLAFIDNPRNNVMEAEQSVWYKFRNTATLALPAPVKRLLEQFNNNEEMT
ncbi:MAG: A/G-specific adenine glycosylase [Gammaproteobacteria bacterium]